MFCFPNALEINLLSQPPCRHPTCIIQDLLQASSSEAPATKRCGQYVSKTLKEEHSWSERAPSALLFLLSSGKYFYVIQQGILKYWPGDKPPTERSGHVVANRRNKRDRRDTGETNRRNNFIRLFHIKLCLSWWDDRNLFSQFSPRRLIWVNRKTSPPAMCISEVQRWQIQDTKIIIQKVHKTRNTG